MPMPECGPLMVVVKCCCASTSTMTRLPREAWREKSLTSGCGWISLWNNQCGPPWPESEKLLRSAMAGMKRIVVWQPPRVGGNGAVCGSSPTPVLAADLCPGRTINGQSAALQLVQHDPDTQSGNLAQSMVGTGGGLEAGKNPGFEIDVHQWWRMICSQGLPIKRGRNVTCSTKGICCECRLPVTSLGGVRDLLCRPPDHAPRATSFWILNACEKGLGSQMRENARCPETTSSGD